VPPSPTGRAFPSPTQVAVFANQGETGAGLGTPHRPPLTAAGDLSGARTARARSCARGSARAVQTTVARISAPPGSRPVLFGPRDGHGLAGKRRTAGRRSRHPTPGLLHPPNDALCHPDAPTPQPNSWPVPTSARDTTGTANCWRLSNSEANSARHVAHRRPNRRTQQRHAEQTDTQ